MEQWAAAASLTSLALGSQATGSRKKKTSRFLLAICQVPTAPYNIVDNMVRPSILLAAAATWLAAQVAGQGCAAVRSNITPKMASGYRSAVIATGLRGPRHIVVDTAGNLLVAEQQGGNVKRLVLQDSGQDVCVASTDTVISGGNV
jgi:glucose/arabinose dehydrogenase